MVNIIIVTYNGIKWLDRSIGNLKGQPLISSIIIIDNGSTDGTIEYIQKELGFVKLIKNSKNYGFGHSNNQGLNISLTEDCKYVFLLNQDAWVEEDTLSHLIKAHEQHNEFGIISPMHLRGDGNALDMKFATFIAQSENYKFISDLFMDSSSMGPLYEVSFVNAAAWLITRSCIEKVGGFAPIYHHYGEDMDYANRVLYHGFRIGICPSATVHHDRPNAIILPDINKPTDYLSIKKIWNLIYLTDIRHSTALRFTKLFFLTTSKCIKSGIRFKFQNSVTYLRESISLVYLAPKVWGNNHKTKKEGITFLNT